MSKGHNFVIDIDVVSVDKKISSKTGAEYYLVSGYVDLGEKYPSAITEFTFTPVQLGKQKMAVSLISDRNKNLSLNKEFVPL